MPLSWSEVGGVAREDCSAPASRGRADQCSGVPRTCSWDRTGPAAVSCSDSDARKEAPGRGEANAPFARRSYSGDSNADKQGQRGSKEEATSEASPEVTHRLLHLEEGLRSQQGAFDSLREDSVEDAKAIKSYLDQVHDVVTSLMRRQEPQSSTPEMTRPQMTRLTSAAQRGDMKVEVQAPDVCRVGEIVLIGGQEAKIVISKGGLVFRVPLERDYPEGTTVRPLRDDEFLQSEGENLRLYRRDLEGDIHFVCHVDLVQRDSPEQADDQDEMPDQFVADNLDQRIQRALEARLAAQRPVSGGGGPMIPPLSSAQEWEGADRQIPPLPDFGRQGDERHQQENGHPPFVRVKQEEGVSQDSLDDYFCKGMDT